MPRTGLHPLKSKEIKDQPIVHRMVTVTTIVYIPVLEGYWRESLEVLKLFFESLITNTGQPFDLMVFDNGSCEEVKTYLRELQAEGKIQYIVFSSKNLRKLGALNFLLSAAPGEFVAYADCDVYFLPGWLDESLKVLEAFPEAGKVTALPLVGGDITTLYARDVHNALSDPSILLKTGILVDQKYIDAHRLSLGKSVEQYQRLLENRKDVLLTRKGVSAYLSGADFQFTISRQAILQALPLVVDDDAEYYDPIYSPVLERRLEDAGLWPLATPEYFVHHMGNSVPNLEAELPWRNDQSLALRPPAQSNHTGRKHHPLWEKRFMRKILKWLNLLTYKLLYEK